MAVVTTVTVYVRPECLEDFIEATRKNHEQSIREPGNLRFDVLQCSQDPDRFLLYEAYQSEEAATAHKKTDHYLIWRQTVESFMAKPREGIPYKVLFPKDRSQW